MNVMPQMTWSVPNELPNVPHLELGTVGNVALAKVREAVLAITGG